MAEDDIQNGAETALTAALSGGQSASLDGMSKSAVSAEASYKIITAERERIQRNAGRRPLFRGIDLGVINGQ